MKFFSWPWILFYGMFHCLFIVDALVTEKSQTYEFTGNIPRIMDIIVHSVYEKNEVVFRELVSNSADALSKARVMGAKSADYFGDKSELEIRIETDGESWISIRDTGIGMTKAELIKNLGTIAKSGTNEFIDTFGGGDSSDTLVKDVIGQFGVGFYSAFLVADKVIVQSKSNDDPMQHVWESQGGSTFNVMEDPEGNTLGRGTKVTLFLKEDAKEFVKVDTIKSIVRRYSEFTSNPIYILNKKEIEVEVPIDTEEEELKSDASTAESKSEELDEEKADDAGVSVSDDETSDEEKKEKDTKPKTRKEKKIEENWDLINDHKPIWRRKKDEVSKAEYVSFYKGLTKDYRPPMCHTHFSAEGELEFTALLYAPEKAPFDMLDNYWTKKSEIRLYVRRVLVADKFEELLPRYLNFAKGIVDSDDLPLNVNREHLQQNRIIKSISTKIVRKFLEMMRKVADGEQELDNADEEEKKENVDSALTDEQKDAAEENKKLKTRANWNKFFGEFGKNLKMGCYEDDSNRGKLAKLLRFTTTKSVLNENKDLQLVSLDEYLDNMHEKQNHIYFMSGDDVEVMRKNPSLEIFKKRDIEVLLLTDQLDEPCIQRLADYEGKKFTSIQKADLKLFDDTDEKKKFKKLKSTFKPLTEWWKDRLMEAGKALDNDNKKSDADSSRNAIASALFKVENVAISKRLVNAPCVVVSSQYGYSPHQMRTMMAQAFQNRDQLMMMAGRNTLEINPSHPLIKDLLQKVQNDPKDKKAEQTALMLFQAAALQSGYDVPDPTFLVTNIYELMSGMLGVDFHEPVAEPELPEDDPETENDGDDDSKGPTDETEPVDFDLDDDYDVPDNESESEEAGGQQDSISNDEL